MRNSKYYIAIGEYERRVIIGSLNNLRNKLIADGRYTDAVNDILVKADNCIHRFQCCSLGMLCQPLKSYPP